MERGAYTESRKHWGSHYLVQGTKQAVGSVQRAKEKLSSGSSQLSPGKVRLGCSMPLHTAKTRITQEIKSQKK